MTPPVYATARPGFPATGIRRPLHPLRSADPQKEINAIRLSFEMFILRRLLEDLIEELERLPEVKSRFRGRMVEARARFNDMRRRLNRNMGREQLEKFEEKVCGVVDSVDEYVNACRLELKSVLVQKIGYEQIDAAALIGLIGGVSRIMQTLNRRLTGRTDYDLQSIMECVEYVDDNYGYRLLNPDSMPDYTPTTEPFVRLFKKIEELIVVDRKGNNFVWR